MRHGKVRCIDIAIDFLILCGDAHKPISQVLAPYLQAETGCFQVHHVIEQNGIEPIFLWTVIRTVPSVGTCQFGAESAGVFPGFLASMFEVEVHQMLIAPEHLVAECLLAQAIHPLVGHHRVFADAPLPVEFGDALASVQVAPPLYDIR